MRLIGPGTALAMLSACNGAANNMAAQNAANAATPANAMANAAQEGPPIPLDERRLLEACVPANERQLTIDQLSPARRTALNRCYNEETVRQLTPQLPLRVDPVTQVVQVSLEGGDLVYRYKIARRLANAGAGLAERLEADTRRHACAGEDVRNIIALGGAQIYRWVDQDDALIREVRVASCPEEGEAQ